MEGPPLGPGGEDITWPDQVAPRGRKASSTRKIKPQTSNRILPARGASGVGRSPTHNRLSLGRTTGSRYPLAVGAGAVGVGTRHLPQSARSCELALRAVGAARGRPARAPLACVWGVRGCALSKALPPVPGACGRGPLPPGCGCGGVWAWGPATNSTSRALAIWFCALWRRHEGARGGASCLRVGRLGSGALAQLTARSWGVRPGPATQ